jgi:mono/diheme cytochrome c family protein
MLNSFISSFYALLNQLGYPHPLHPTQVHLPVGLVLGAFILYFLGRVSNKPQLGRSARHCTIIALIFTFPTIATGLMDWQHFYAGQMLFPFRMKFILAPILLIILSAGLFFGRESRGGTKVLAAVYPLSLLVVAALGYFGGEIVFGGKTAPAAEAFRAGQEIYMANCGSCHKDGGNIINPDVPVKNSPKTADFDTFVAWIRKPKAPMPAFPNTVLSDSEARDLFEYVKNVLNK